MRPHRNEHIDNMTQRALQILWPAFLVAGLLEILVFAVVDPGDLHWFGGPALAWPSQAVYTLAFFVFWAAVSAAAALSVWLGRPAADINRDAF
jgi:membrane protein DedA with SNARE-associated domain